MNIALHQAAAAMTANMQWHDLVAQNLSGQSSPGYRAQVGGFEEFRIPGSPSPTTSNSQSASAYPMLRTGLNRNQGALQPTGSLTDLGLEGPGFFAVQAPGGGRAFTRDGQFHVDRQGSLMTKEGYPVLGDTGPVRVDPQAGAVSFGPRGEISQGGVVRGQVQLVEVADPAQLQHLSGSYYRLPANLKTTPAAGTTVQTGFLEGANTSSVQEMGNMLLAMRHFEANQRALQVADERMGRSIQELGTPPQ
jgi:flagellar basal body rod protein FlgG